MILRSIGANILSLKSRINAVNDKDCVPIHFDDAQNLISSKGKLAHLERVIGVESSQQKVDAKTIKLQNLD